MMSGKLFSMTGKVR